MRMTWDAPYPRQNLSRLGWMGLLAIGCIVVGFASQGWFTATYAAGGVEAAAMLYFIMRAEIGPTGWSAWHVESIVERLCTAGAWSAVQLGYMAPADIAFGQAVTVAKAQTALDKRTCGERERRSASAIGQRLHRLLHTSLLRSHLTSTRAATTAIR
jgi:hypothetical protein